MAPPGASVSPVGNANATILIYLSLFLLLLVFFVVLVAQSVPRDYRVRAVLDSVGRNFPQGVDSTRGGDAANPATGVPSAIALAGLKRLGDLFETDLAVVKVEEVGHGRLMAVSMPGDQLFLGNSAFVRRDRAGLLDRIAREIGDHGGARFDVDFLVAMGDEPAGSGPVADPVARAAALARALLADRAPPDSVAVGVEPGPADTVRFLFSARPSARAGGVR